MLKTSLSGSTARDAAYHLGEGRVLKTEGALERPEAVAYHLGEGRVLKTAAGSGARGR